MKPQSVILAITLMLFACNNDKGISTTQTNGQIVLIDFSAPTENLRQYQASDRYGYYPVYYIGKLTDTIRLRQRQVSRYSDEQDQYSESKNFTLAYSAKMKIIVDTAFSLAHTVYYKHYSEEESKEIIDSTISFKAYPIFVYNLSDSLFSIGSFSEFGYTIKQAKDEHGNWVDIETPIRYFCATGARDIVIEPNQVMVAKLLRFKGDFKTECRLKFTRLKRTVYSNTFTDYIDKKQLTDILKSEY